MADFSDHEDRQLVHLALDYEERAEKISWAAVAAAMRGSKKDARALKRRLTTLKATYGKAVRLFPRRFFKPSVVSRRPALVPLLPRLVQTVAAICAPAGNAVTSVRAEECTLLAQDLRPPCDKYQCAAARFNTYEGSLGQDQDRDYDLLPPDISCEVVQRIFRHVHRSDILQASGQPHFNVGELAPSGVTELIKRCQMTQDDGFLDLGSGVGNVIAQVCLQTDVKQAIGIEVRRGVALLGIQAISNAVVSYPRLARAKNIVGNLCDLLDDRSKVAGTTVLYSNNFVFAPSTTLAIEKLCCLVPELRVVVLCTKVCPRHTHRCAREFCLLWHEQPEPLKLQNEYRSTPTETYVYMRNTEC